MQSSGTWLAWRVLLGVWLLIQVVSLVGSLLILGAFIASQFRWMETTNLSYVLLNLVGSAILSVVAIVERQWGFLLLEGVWAIVSLWSTVKLLSSRRTGPGH